MSRQIMLASTAVAAWWCSPALAPVVPPVARALGLPRRHSDPGAVAVTFDDGPHPEGTPAVLETLREADAPATFFLVGEQVERNPALAAEIAAAGHTIAVHAHRHRNSLRLTPRAFETDVEQGIDAIATATGSAPDIHRAPYGIYSPAALAAVRRRGLYPILWSRWGHDWRASATAESIAAEVTESLRGGDVLLLHDADHYSARESWRATAAALPEVLRRIEAAGLVPTGLKEPRQRQQTRGATS
jgi:peptidoglycan/xylan/chitin deacetylase (PgdA/CDA1 family)